MHIEDLNWPYPQPKLSIFGYTRQLSGESRNWDVLLFCFGKRLEKIRLLFAKAVFFLTFRLREEIFNGKRIDVQTLQSLRNGDHDAFRAVYLHYVESIQRLLVQLTRNDETARELTQSVFITLWEKRGRIDPDNNITGYLFTIARNSVFKYFDHLKVERKYQDEAIYTGSQSESSATDDNVVTEQTKSIVDNAISGMPEQRRKIFSMFYYDSLSPEQICKELNLKRSTVETHLALARKDIKNAL